MNRTALSADRVRLLSRLLDEKGIVRQAPAIGARDVGLTEIPLSFAQQRMWFSHRLQPASMLYNIGATARLSGPLDVTVLRRCIKETVRRHEILRTTYRFVNGHPVQCVAAPPDVGLPVEDLSGQSGSDRAAGLRAWQDRLVNEPYDLERDLPLRAGLARLGPLEHQLVIAQHHIASDGWSLGVFVRELAELYLAFLAGRPSPLPELPVQYADYAIWQREWLAAGAERGQLDYWRERLAGAPLLELPTGRAPAPARSWDGSSVPFELPAALVRGLTALGDSQRATLYMVLLAATSVIFSRWSGSTDVVIGTPIANRNRLETEDLMGCFVNTLPLRVDLAGDPTFRSLLRQAREVCLGAYAHQDAQFERIVEDLNPERGPGGQSPLVRHMLGLHNAPRPVLSLPDLRIEFESLRAGKARFDLELVLYPADDGGIDGRVWFGTDLFDAGTVSRLVAGIAAVLRAAAADPDLPVGRMPVLAEPERARVLERFSGAAAGDWAPSDPVRAYAGWLRDVLGFQAGDAAAFLGPASEPAALDPLAPLLLGGRSLVPGQEQPFEAGQVAAMLAAERPSLLTCTPSQLAELLAAGLAPGPALRHVLLSGEAPWPGLAAECQRALPGTAVWTLIRCGARPTAAGLLPEPAAATRLAGRPIAGATLYVLDRQGELTPIGVAGELHAGGPVTTADGRQNPYRPGESLYPAGERARWRPDGTLELAGETDQASAGLIRVRDALLSHPLVDRAEVVRGQDGRVPGDGTVGYFSLRRDEAPPRDPRSMFEERYASRSMETDLALNPATWTSPVTGTPLAAGDVRDWLETTVRHALALRPRQVLEIGCRNGLLLLRLAPQCLSYSATDLSARALSHIRESKDWVTGRAGAVRLLRQAPDDFSGIEAESCDLVLMNSVAQHAPDLSYLERVLAGAIRVIRPGGAILVGDVRSLPLLPALHAWSACQSAPGLTPAELSALVTDRIDREDELVIDPAWFRLAAGAWPEITEVTVLARTGRKVSELTSFRYDVVLRTGGTGTGAGPVSWLDPPEAIELLAAGQLAQAGLRDVADGPVPVAARAAELAATSRAASLAGLWEEAAARTGTAVSLAELRAAAELGGYGTLRAGPAASGKPGLLDVVVSRTADLPRLGPCQPGPLGFATDVRHVTRARAAVALLRGHLRERLPEAVIPGHLVVRRTWPARPSGIADLAGLPRPQAAAGPDSQQRPPQTETEIEVARIWSDVLGIDQVGLDDDFFALGGHSLLGAELVERVRTEFSVELPLGQLFDEPTVAAVAAYVASAPRAAEPVAMIKRIDRASFRRPTARALKD